MTGIGCTDQRTSANDRASCLPSLADLQGGAITFVTSASIPCMLRNLSQGEACIEVRNAQSWPDAFTLLIKPELLKAGMSDRLMP